MAKSGLHNYNTQAKLAIVLAGVAALGMLGLIYLLFLRGNFNREMQVIVYGKQSIYAPMIFVTTAVTMLFAAAGAAIGASSAGQKRNELSRQSWLAFFIGGSVFSLTFVLFAAFWSYRLSVG